MAFRVTQVEVEDLARDPHAFEVAFEQAYPDGWTDGAKRHVNEEHLHGGHGSPATHIQTCGSEGCHRAHNDGADLDGMESRRN
jgi:hypothetical protein